MATRAKSSSAYGKSAEKVDGTRNFFRRVAAEGAFSGIFILEGEEVYLRDLALQRLEAAVFPEGRDSLNFERLTAGDVRGGEVCNTAQTLPMFATRRMIIVSRAQAFSAADWASLATYVDNPEPATVLVLCADSLDKRLKPIKALIDAAGTGHVVLEAPPSHELAGWIEKRAAAKGMAVGREVAGEISASIGGSLQQLDNTLERVALYVGAKPGDRVPVRSADVREVVPDVRVRSVFELVDQIMRRDAAGALLTARLLMEEGESPIGINAMLARQARQLLGLSDVGSDGEAAREAARLVGVPPFKVAEVSRTARGFTVRRLRHLLLRVAQTDAKLKSSRLDESVWMESLIFDLCRSR